MVRFRRILSNRYPFQILKSMADLLVRVSVWAYISDVIGHQVEKMRNGLDLRIGRRLENLKRT